jgi:hypothetical protein
MSLHARLIALQKKLQGKMQRSDAPSEAQADTGATRKMFSVIFDVSNQSIIAITKSVPVANVLVETMLDSAYTHGVTLDEISRLSLQDPTTYPETSWDMYRRSVRKTHPDLITADMRERALLAARRIDALTFALNSINNIRQRTRTGFLFQDRIYELKEAQARMLKESKYDANLLAKVPYVTQDAEDRNISVVEATEDILVHAELFNEFLLRSERARLSLVRAIKKAKTAEEISAAVEKFRLDGVL